MKNTGKIAAVLGAPPQTPRWPLASGGFASNPQVATPVTCSNYLKLRPIISYVSDGLWALLSQACSYLAQTSSYATVHTLRLHT